MFLPHVGKIFRVYRTADDTVELTLDEVAPYVAPHGVQRKEQTGREPFSIYFHGPIHLSQRIYRFEHPDAGAFEIFIVPIARDAEGYRYEAVFN